MFVEASTNLMGLSRNSKQGSLREASFYEEKDISSPTVKQESVMMIAEIAAQVKRSVVTVDITGACLNSDMSKSKVHKAEILCAFIVCRDGTVVVRLDEALHGCIESARFWCEHHSQTLIKTIYFV